MDNSVFLTQQAASSGKGLAPGQTLTGGHGIFSGQAGMSFMDLIFARMTAEAGTDSKAQNAKQDAAKPSPAQSQILLNKLIKKLAGNETSTASLPDLEGHNDPLTTEQILQSLLQADPGALEDIASAEELAALQAAFAVDGNGKASSSMPQIIADKKTLDAFLDSLLIGLPQDSKLVLIEITPGKAQKMLQQLQSEDGASPSLIATGLNPEQLTKLLEDIANGDEQGVFGIASLIKILPPQAKREAIFLPRGVVVAQPQHPAGDVNTPASADTLASKLNTLTTGEGSTPLEEGDFEGVLRVLERAQTMGQKNGQQADGTDKGIENAIKQVKDHVSAGLSAIQGTPPALTEIFSSFAINDMFPDGWDFATGSRHSLNLTGPAQLTSIVSHIQQAGLPHPATQMVASVIAKASTNGESKNITIQLDPPDLGKVSVRMEFNKESNTMKALLVAEKPETFLMLQRDAHILERALQNAGIDTDGGLSFELAQDGNMLDHDQHDTGGKSGGGHNGNGGDSDGDNAIEIIETTMDWYVDPDTGLTRYDALV